MLYNKLYWGHMEGADFLLGERGGPPGPPLNRPGTGTTLPIGLCVPVASVVTRRHLRSANRQLLAVPRYHLNTYGRRAFSVAGSTV